MVKLADIAKVLDLNVSVISRALNPNPDKNAVVKKETAELIRKTAEEMGYVPNRQAAFLGKGKGATIFCYLPDVSTRLINDLMFGITAEAGRENFPVNFFFGKNINDFKKFLAHGNRIPHTGLITFPPGKMSDEMKQLFEQYYKKCNNILFLNTISNAPDTEEMFLSIPTLNIDEYYGGVLAGKHLYQCNCDEFLIIGEKRQYGIFEEREKGFTEFLLSEGVEINKISFAEIEVFPFKKGVKYGIFADSDYVALNTYPVFARKNLEIGKDILLVGFDDIFYSRISLPSLTTVHQPTRDEGHAAVKKMINMIFGKTEQSETLKPFLAVRESTGGKRPDPEHPELEECLE